jgi:rhodanese-related sulfurtransferase
MQKTVKYTLLIITISLLMVSCSAIFEDGKEMADFTKSSIEEISVDDLNKKLENGEDFLLIDVRQLKEYDATTIPGALNIPRGVLEFKIRDEAFWEEEFMYVPEDTADIVLFCKKGDRGILAAKSLEKIGFKNVKNLHGGITAYDPEFDSGAAKPAESGGCGG